MKNPKTYEYAELKLSAGRYYVYFKMFDPSIEKLRAQRIYIKKYKTEALIKREGKRLCNDINIKLEQGWNPLIEEKGYKQYLFASDALDRIKIVFETYSNKKTRSTLKKRIDILKKWLLANNHKLSWISSFDSAIANDFMDSISTMKNKDGKYLSARTFNNYLSDYRLVFNLLKKRGFVKENAFEKVDFKIAKESEIFPFTREQQEKYTNYLLVNDYNFFVISGMVYYLALRPVEITRLFVSDVNLKKGFVRISGEKSKNSRTRLIPIANAFKRHLEAYLKDANPNDYFVSKGYVPGPKYYHSTRISERFARIRKKLKLPDNIYFYSLKHTTADQLLSNNFDVRLLQQLFRHKSLEETDIYAKKIRPFFNERLINEFPSFECSKGE